MQVVGVPGQPKVRIGISAACRGLEGKAERRRAGVDGIGAVKTKRSANDALTLGQPWLVVEVHGGIELDAGAHGQTVSSGGPAVALGRRVAVAAGAGQTAREYEGMRDVAAGNLCQAHQSGKPGDARADGVSRRA